MHKTVDAAEWLFDKGAQLVNYVGQKATDVTDWIASTRAAGLVKDIGSWAASTTIFKKAVEITTYIFMKMSNFCTAIVESYQYYNQCRTMSRRIVNEKLNIVDEHTILRSCDEVMKQEAKITNNNINTDYVSFVIFCKKKAKSYNLMF